MPKGTPGEILFRRRSLTVLRRVLMAAQPHEGCALLLGGWGSAPGAHAPLEILLIWPCLNLWEPASERTRRFLLDPREQLLAQRWGRLQGLQVLGSAHSHPCSDPVPSATDLELAFAPTLQLILSPLTEWTPACWWLELSQEGLPSPRPLQWRMVD